ncbi:MAG TPA: hypothetical protein VLC08_07675, partial [Chitinolyticbacter sp.]|nr:hypothetical protein [Chitinolyticbacter sp.]
SLPYLSVFVVLLSVQEEKIFLAFKASTSVKIVFGILMLVAIPLFFVFLIQYANVYKNIRPDWVHRVSREHVEKLAPFRAHPILGLSVDAALLQHDEPKVPVQDIGDISIRLAYAYPFPNLIALGVMRAFELNRPEQGRELLGILVERFPEFVDLSKNAIESRADVAIEVRQRIREEFARLEAARLAKRGG